MEIEAVCADAPVTSSPEAHPWLMVTLQIEIAQKIIYYY